MNISNFLIMRHEILLLILILVLLVGEIFVSENKKINIIHTAIFLFGLHTVIGFLPLEESGLFGGSFQTTGLIHFFKNVLN